MPETLDKESLKALSTETRQDIVKLLSQRPYTASELSKNLNKHVTTVTEHLNVLEKSGLIARKESGNKWVYYTLSEKGGKLFKPAYYSWIITLSISAIFIVFGLSQIFIIESGEKDMAPAVLTGSAKGNVSGENILEAPIDTGIILIIIGILIAVAGSFYIFYNGRKKKK